MKNIRVETKGGAIFTLKECSVHSEDGIIHLENGEMHLYTIQEGDTLTELA